MTLDGLKIHYLSCHEVLEWQEVSLLTELGAKVFSNGAYLDPKGHVTLKRPGIPDAPYYPDYVDLATKFPKTNLPAELIEPFDVIIVMHTPEVISENWERIKHKKVIWRSIGQSMSSTENMLRRFKYEGMKVVRYSPMESNIPGFIGSDAMIRFCGDPNELCNWNGETKRVINITQTLQGRGIFCHYNDITQLLNGFPSLVYGSGNENLGSLNGGELSYDLLKGAMRDSRVFVYGGTFPACYTLSFIDALMTGIPVVCIGQKLAEEMPEIAQNDRYHFYEIPEIIQNGRNGFISDNINELRTNIDNLLNDEDLAKKIGKAGRDTAIKFFDKSKIKDEWRKFLEAI